MTFTKTPPTVPGFYAFRENYQGEITRVGVVELVEMDGLRSYATGLSVESLSNFGGEWCRLVPAEEVEMAFRESALTHDRAIVSEFAWNTSRAKQVAEGTK